MRSIADYLRRSHLSGKVDSVFSLLVLLVVMLLAKSALAQTINLGGDVSRPVPGAGHDYIHMLNETVDPESGNLSLKIDLPVPKGRGLTLPFSITYNSGEVFRFSSLMPGCGALGPTSFCAGGAPPARVTDGWSDTFPYATIGDVTEIPAPAPYSETSVCAASLSWVFYDPSGGSHMLGLAGIGGSPICMGVSYNNPSCMLDPHSGKYICTGGPGYEVHNVGGDDQVIAQSPYCDLSAEACSELPPFTVTDDSGTTYYFPSGQSLAYPTWIEDRNGNKIQVSTASSLSLTDTLGRQVVGVSGSFPAGTTAYQVGDLTYNATWGTATANFTTTGSQLPLIAAYQGIQIGCRASFTVAAQGSSALNVIKVINLPNGQQYQISYDSTWGLPSQITYPDGGWVQYTWKASDTQNTLATFDGNGTNTNNPAPYYGACNYIYAAPVVATRTVGYTPGVTAQYQQFTYYTCWNSSSAAPTCPSNPDGHNPANQNTTPATTYPTDPRVWQWNATKVVSTNYLPNNTTETATTYYTYGSVFQSYQPNSGGQLRAQLPVESTIDYQDWNGSLIKTVNKVWDDQFSMASETDTYPNTGSVKTNYTYVGVSGTLAYLQEKDEYDFGQSSPFETTKYSYSSFTGPSFLTDTSGVTVGVPSQVIASSGGTTLAETDATYDGATPSGVSNLPQGTHDTAYEGTSPFLSRGNPTKVVRCTSGTGSSCAGPTTTYTYDVTGQVTSKTDPCGNSSCSDMSASNFKTTYSYSDNFTGGGSPSGNTNAYLTNMTYPTVNGAALQENFTYNYTTGALLTDKDENGQTTTYTYADPLNRLTEIQGPPDPNNGNQQPTTSRSYNDTAPSPSVTVTVLQSPDPAISRVEVRDGMGHAVQSQLTSDPAGTVYVDTTYDGEGGVFQKSNPTRCSSSPGSMPSSCSESTWGVTSYFYDALGRVVAQKEPDGSALTWCYNDTVSSMPSGVTATCNSHIGSSSVDTWVDSTDENGNDSQRTTNAFGNLIEVMEPDGSTKNPPAMETDYTYDALSNLLSVKQWGGASGSSGARTRSFSYDSLSQLVQGFNPESGWTCYGTTGGAVPNGSNCTEGYDGNGNLASKTVGQGAPANAIGVTTSYVYDSLNRLTSKSYSSNDASRTPISCYQYDLSSVTNGAGRLANEWTQSYSSSPCNASLLTNGGYLTLKSILAYDSMGRPTSAQQQQCTPGKCAAPTPYAMTFGYDLAGNPKTLINSVGANNAPLTLTAGFDGAAHMNGVTSSWTSYPTNIYTLNNYGPVGPLNWSLGPTSPSPTLTISQGYTNRLWVNSISATGQVP